MCGEAPVVALERWDELLDGGQVLRHVAPLEVERVLVTLGVAKLPCLVHQLAGGLAEQRGAHASHGDRHAIHNLRVRGVAARRVGVDFLADRFEHRLQPGVDGRYAVGQARIVRPQMVEILIALSAARAAAQQAEPAVGFQHVLELAAH
jgi:hypothetical protein